jgi:hypothetical protein
MRNISDIEFSLDSWTVALATGGEVRLVDIGYLRDPHAAVCRQAGGSAVLRRDPDRRARQRTLALA